MNKSRLVHDIHDSMMITLCNVNEDVFPDNLCQNTMGQFRFFKKTYLSLHFLTYLLPPPSPHPFQCCADVRRRLVSEVLLFCYSNIERGARGELII